MKTYTVVSLFSGAGGLDLGFVQSGRYRMLFANDVLSSALTTYAKNLDLKLELCSSRRTEARPGVALVCDVAEVDFAPLGDVDVIVGGPPCQDFSIVRGPSWDRRGIEVRRGRLYAHFVRALATLRPKAFVFENVPGLISTNGGLAYKVILDDFSNLKLRWEEVRKVAGAEGAGVKPEGYEIVFADVVDFAKLGVPQRRERLIIAGLRRDIVKNRDVWDIRAKFSRAVHGGGLLFFKYPLTAIEAFEGSTLENLGDVYREVMREWEGVWKEVGTPRAYEWKEREWDRLTFDIVKDYLTVSGIRDASDFDEAMEQHKRVLTELGYYGVPVSSLKLQDGTTEEPSEDPRVVERMRMIPPGENHEFVRGTKWEVEGRGISLVYRRLHPLKPSYTIVAYGGGGTHGYHYRRNRATLTLRERARLQTFPDTFLFYGRRSEIRAQIGEAVPPLAGKKIAQALAEVLDLL